MTVLLLLTIAHESDPRRRHVSTVRVALELMPQDAGQGLLLQTTVVSYLAQHPRLQLAWKEAP